MSHHRLALRACFTALFAAIAGCGDAPTGSTLSRLSPLGRSPLADISAAATTTLANQGASGLCLGVSGTGFGSLSSLQGCTGAAIQGWSVPSTGTTGVVKLSASGQCMDAFGGSSQPGDRIGLWSCTGDSNQQFTLTAAGELKVANGLCVGPQGTATASTGLVLQQCTGAATQKWSTGTTSTPPVTTTPTARFTSQLTNAATGLCLTSSVAGAIAGLQSCASTGLQLWSVAGVNGAGTVNLIATGECLDAFGGDANAGDIVGIYSCNGGRNQAFTLTTGGELRVSTGFCVAPASDAAASGTTLQLQVCTGGASQRWNTSATITTPTPTTPTTALPTARFAGPLASSAATGLCLTASSASAGVVTALQSCASSTLQTWSVPGGGSAGAVTSAANAGLCVDAFGGWSAVGDRIGLWGCNGGGNQTYTLTAAGELRTGNGYCVGPVGGVAVAGASMQLQTCTGSSAQKWTTSGATISEPAPAPAPAPAPTPAPAPAPAPIPAPTAPTAPTGALAIEPTLPTELAVPSDIAVTGRTWRPLNGDALREAMEQAQMGDEILLQPGTRYVGYLFLPPKSGSGWITIRTDLSAGEMPAPGVRVTPASASRFAKIVAQGRNDPAIQAMNGSRGWRFAAVEVMPHDSITHLSTLVVLGVGNATSISEMPTDFIFDRVYVHGLPNKELSRCFLLNSGRTAIVNSSIEECHSASPFSTAIGGISGTGPYRIENNSISGAGMGIFFGGDDPRIANVSPSDIVIRNNRVWRPMSWKGQWGAATLVEIKHARRMLFEGNLFENHWVSTLTEYAVLIKSVNQSGGAPWSQSTDITFRRNIVRNAPSGLNLAGKPEQFSAVPGARIKVEHNLFYNIGESNGTTGGRMVVMTGPLSDVQLLNNTLLHNGFASHAMMVDGSETSPQAARIVVNNNIWTHGEWGWTGYWQGTRALSFFAGSSHQAVGNVFIGAGLTSTGPAKYLNSTFAESISQIGFLNPSAGDFTLSGSSAFSSAGAGGSTPGANMSALLSATSAARAMQ